MVGKEREKAQLPGHQSSDSPIFEWPAADAGGDDVIHQDNTRTSDRFDPRTSGRLMNPHVMAAI